MERVPATRTPGGRAPTRISGSSERRTTSLHGGPPRRNTRDTLEDEVETGRQDEVYNLYFGDFVQVLHLV